MRIGELASATATPVDTIRHYERAGLLPAPPRSGANYRRYGEGDVQRLRFIRRCRGLDMGLDEVRHLLALHDAPQAACGEVNALIDAHLAHVDARLRELRALQQELKALRARCGEDRPVQDCGILRALEDEALSPPAPSSGPNRCVRPPGSPCGRSAPPDAGRG